MGFVQGYSGAAPSRLARFGAAIWQKKTSFGGKDSRKIPLLRIDITLFKGSLFFLSTEIVRVYLSRG